MGCLASSSADVDVGRTEGPEGTGEKAAEVAGDVAKESVVETSALTGFKVLGGFENKPVQKVLYCLFIYF